MCSDSETSDLHSVQIYIRRQKLRLLANIVAVHYGSYQRANKYLYTVVNWPSTRLTCTHFSSNHFIQILYLFVHPHFLE